MKFCRMYTYCQKRFYRSLRSLDIRVSLNPFWHSPLLNPVYATGTEHLCLGLFEYKLLQHAWSLALGGATIIITPVQFSDNSTGYQSDGELNSSLLSWCTRRWITWFHSIFLMTAMQLVVATAAVSSPSTPIIGQFQVFNHHHMAHV